MRSVARLYARTYTQTNKLILTGIMPTNVCVCVVHIRTKTKVDDKDHKSDYIINSHMPKENILEISKAQAQPKQ